MAHDTVRYTRSEAAIRIWKMIAACCCCFLPSDQFKKTLFAFLLQHANDKQAGGMKVDTAKPKKRSVFSYLFCTFYFYLVVVGVLTWVSPRRRLAPVVLQNDNIGRLATFSMRSLRRTYQNGIRQMPPSDEEVIAVTVQLPAPPLGSHDNVIYLLMRRTTNLFHTEPP